jgi:hypothetical protein
VTRLAQLAAGRWRREDPHIRRRCPDGQLTIDLLLDTDAELIRPRTCMDAMDLVAAVAGCGTTKPRLTPRCHVQEAVAESP